MSDAGCDPDAIILLREAPPRPAAENPAPPPPPPPQSLSPLPLFSREACFPPAADAPLHRNAPQPKNAGGPGGAGWWAPEPRAPTPTPESLAFGHDPCTFAILVREAASQAAMDGAAPKRISCSGGAAGGAAGGAEDTEAKAKRRRRDQLDNKQERDIINRDELAGVRDYVADLQRHDAAKEDALRKQNEIEDEVMKGQQAWLHGMQAQVQAQVQSVLVQSTQARLSTVPPSRSMLKRLVLVLTVFSSGADGSGLQAARAGPVHLTASLERLAHWSRSSPLDRLQRSSWWCPLDRLARC